MLHHAVNVAARLVIVVTICSGFCFRAPYLHHRQKKTILPRRGLAFHSTSSNIQENNGIDQERIKFSSSNRTLYPLAKRLRNGTLEVDSTHTLYYEEYGKANENESSMERNTKTRIAISLHGGPGAGSFPRHSQFFDPEKYDRVILFDQRGCGRSTPRGETKFNTLQHLVNDIEELRVHLDVKSFDVVLGGSWGSTLALAYSQSFPERVGSIVLRGVCLFRPEEIDWLFGNEEWNTNEEKIAETSNSEEGNYIKINCISNAKEMLDAWNVYKETVENDETESASALVETNSRRRVLTKYYNYLMGADAVARAIVTKSWFKWEMGVSSFNNFSSFENWDVGKVGDLILWDSSSKQWTSEMGKVEDDIIESLRRWPQRAPLVCTSNASSGLIHPLPDEKLLYDADAVNISIADAEKFVPAQTILTCHYSINDKYMMSNFPLLSKENIDKIRHIPCIAVQGAKDLICPPDSALDLCESWPEMDCVIVADGKHSMYDPLICSELIKATDRLANMSDNR